ncbi:MAG: hypothetical protein JNL49_14210 [Bacteroidia bacterium]|nr:hypothetical protein [Bacteroidia bacterium]
MKVLPGIDLLEDSLSNRNYPNNRTIVDILYNEENRICFSKIYIEHIEKKISNRDAFEALIRELYDTSRISIECTSEKNTPDEEFIEIASKSDHSILIPIILNSKQLFENLPSLVVINNVKPINDHWIKYKLLSSKNCNVSFQDFKTETEIASFFNSVFSISKHNNEIFIFDRETTETHLSKIKGKKIKYYTYLKGKRSQYYTLIPDKRNLKKALGGKLRLYYTCNGRKIHERKIIFDNIIVTIDNSRKNVTIQEPTWEVFISVDSKKAQDWKGKCTDFFELTDN